MNTGRVSWIDHDTLREGQVWAPAEVGFTWVIDDAQDMHKVRNYKLVTVPIPDTTSPGAQLALDFDAVSA